MATTVYLIPTVLADGVTTPLPSYILTAIKSCSVFFVENERTARRFVKLLCKEFVIDDYEWHKMKDATPELIALFKQKCKENRTIGLMSEAGCPGVADPGQHLVHAAQQMNVTVKPMVGPSAILLALMASGMNGQQFYFHGYLPIDIAERAKTIKQLEAESKQKNCTQIFIETPYRNNQMLETILKTCAPQTQVCVGVDITASTESVQTKTVQQWKTATPQIHKRPAIFLLYAGAV